MKGSKENGRYAFKDGLRSLKAEMDYSKHGGAVLFGLKAPVIKLMEQQAPMLFAIRSAKSTMLETDVVGQLVEQFEKAKNSIWISEAIRSIEKVDIPENASKLAMV